MSTDRDRAHLHPHVLSLLERHESEIRRRLGLPTTVLETWRDGWRQDEAKRLGLSEKGAGASHHNVVLPDGTPASCAYHLGIDPAGPLLIGFGSSLIHPTACKSLLVDMGRHGFRGLSPEEMLYCSIGLIGEDLGLTWGGRWDVNGKGPDWTHFQLAAPLSHIWASINAGRAIA